MVARVDMAVIGASAGAARIRAAGGLLDAMPRAAIAATQPDRIAGLAEMPGILIDWSSHER